MCIYVFIKIGLPRLWGRIKTHILSALGFWCHVLMFSPHTDLMRVCSFFIHSDMSINQAFVRTQACVSACCLVDNGEEIKPGLRWWSYRSLLLLWSAGKCILWNSLQFRKKEILFKRSAYATDGISPQVLHAGKIYQSAKEQMNPSWPREIFMLIGFQAQPLH